MTERERVNVVEVRDVSKRFGRETAVDQVSFGVESESIIALLGPSGCGKTTTLRLIAGFETPDSGTIAISGRSMAGKRPYERNIGLLFQDYALFPHMTVVQNVRYGLHQRGFEKARISRRANEMLELVKLTGFEQRRPSQLSGGEQQRVALARALATGPEVMLLDEPLSALDAKLRMELQSELKEILRAVGSTTIVVTHDQEEAMSLAEHIIVMDAGRIRQEGTPTEIYARPTSKFVAEFIGRSNWFAGNLEPGPNAGLQTFRSHLGINLVIPKQGTTSPGKCEVGVRPERIEVLREADGQGGVPEDSYNRLSGKIAEITHLGAEIHVLVDLAAGKRVLAIQKNLGRQPDPVGTQVALRFPADSCILVPVDA